MKKGNQESLTPGVIYEFGCEFVITGVNNTSLTVDPFGLTTEFAFIEPEDITEDYKEIGRIEDTNENTI